jgi:hypothetical protein
MTEQIVSFVGALLILAAYTALQAGRTKADAYLYLLMNLAGSLILAIIAARIKQVGLTVLEGSWAVITLIAFWKRLLKRDA